MLDIGMSEEKSLSATFFLSDLISARWRILSTKQYSEICLLTLLFIPSRVSGRGYKIGLVCVSVCLCVS